MWLASQISYYFKIRKIKTVHGLKQEAENTGANIEIV